MTTTVAQAMKQGIRQSIIASRAALPAAARQTRSQGIQARILRLESYRKAGTVLGYMHFGAEFVSEPWLQQVLRDGKNLLLPKVNMETRELDLFRVNNLQTQLVPGAYGIREPEADSCERFERFQEIDFILLPGVAFGRDGSRIGYGGGFYDRLLARLQHSPALVAGAFSMQIVDDIPQIGTDRRIEWLVTENEVIDCSATGKQ